MRAQTSNNPEAPEPQPPPEAPPANGRDSGGRFTAGNKYGPGNPFARQTAQLRKVLLEVVTPEEMRQVAFTLLLLAKAGKLEATKLLFQYVLGKPAEAVDPDRLDAEEWKLSQESKVNPAAVHETVQHMPAETANVLVRHVWPASTETNYLSPAREELDAMDREDAERARAAREQPAEANGCDDEREGSAKPQAAPLTPDPSPPKRARGEEEAAEPARPNGSVGKRGRGREGHSKDRPSAPSGDGRGAPPARRATGGPPVATNPGAGPRRQGHPKPGAFSTETNGGNGPKTSPHRPPANGDNGAGRHGPPPR